MTLFDTDETLEVAQLLAGVNRSLRREFPREVWVRGQIRDLNPDRRADRPVYFRLTTPTPSDATPSHAVAVVLFSQKKQVINRQLKEAGGSRMEDGMEVRIRGQVQIYESRSQLQIVMSAIDPEYTLARLAADREALVLKLRAEGVLEQNSRLDLPLVPLRVALVTSDKSDAQADVISHLEASPYAFAVTTYSAQVQGVSAPESIARALTLAGTANPDVVCLTRGGGSRTDLAPFDAEIVARAIAACPVPVIAGIGHQRDESVADLTAAVPVKTPTAAAEWLINRVTEVDGRFRDLGLRVAKAARDVPTRRLERVDILAERAVASGRRATARADERLEARSGRITAAAHGRLVAQQRVVDGLTSRLTRRVPHLIAGEHQRVEGLDLRVRALDPQRLLKRGWSITTSADGTPIRSCSDAPPGTTLHTRVADGVISSDVRSVISDRSTDEPRDDR